MTSDEVIRYERSIGNRDYEMQRIRVMERVPLHKVISAKVGRRFYSGIAQGYAGYITTLTIPYELLEHCLPILRDNPVEELVIYDVPATVMIEIPFVVFLKLKCKGAVPCCKWNAEQTFIE